MLRGGRKILRATVNKVSTVSSLLLSISLFQADDNFASDCVSFILCFYLFEKLFPLSNVPLYLSVSAFLNENWHSKNELPLVCFFFFFLLIDLFSSNSVCAFKSVFYKTLLQLLLQRWNVISMLCLREHCTLYIY